LLVFLFKKSIWIEQKPINLNRFLDHFGSKYIYKKFKLFSRELDRWKERRHPLFNGVQEDPMMACHLNMSWSPTDPLEQWVWGFFITSFSSFSILRFGPVLFLPAYTPFSFSRIVAGLDFEIEGDGFQELNVKDKRNKQFLVGIINIKIMRL